MHIGLLEDDIAIQEMLRLVLYDEGYSVIVYSSADECLDALFTALREQARIPIDLLIVDWRLSGSAPGTEVIRQLRDNPAFEALPIILTTAAAFTNTDELENLHISLLEKPFAVDEVVELINKLVRSGTKLDC
ncbi:MAG: response regulator [Ktedonobacteraceae bacterium]|jgi:two-component system, chemotaxis family, chemotaxis protein CheY